MENIKSASGNADSSLAAQALETALDGKVDKEAGKGLSSNDYTDAEKAKLASIPVLDYTSLEEQLVPGESWDGKQVYLRTFKGNLPTTPLEGQWLLPLTQGLQVIPVQAWGWVSQENWGDPYLVPNSKVDIISKGWYGLSIMFDSLLVGRAYLITAKYIKA